MQAEKVRKKYAPGQCYCCRTDTPWPVFLQYRTELSMTLPTDSLTTEKTLSLKTPLLRAPAAQETLRIWNPTKHLSSLILRQKTDGTNVFVHKETSSTNPLL